VGPVESGTLRPRIAVVPAPSPDLTASPLGTAFRDAGYVVAHVDGAHAFVVPADETELAERLARPVEEDGSWTTQEADGLRTRIAELTLERDQLSEELTSWRASSVEHWSDVAATQRASSSLVEADRLRDELDAVRATLSWRITAPLRAVRGRRIGRTR